MGLIECQVYLLRKATVQITIQFRSHLKKAVTDRQHPLIIAGALSGFDRGQAT